MTERSLNGRAEGAVTGAESFSEEETRRIAAEIGEKALPGEIYALYGDLGAGKTVFAKGFAEGLGIRAAVTSPTFNIVKEYEGGRLPFFHFDVYRIADPEEMLAIGFEEYFYRDGICLIEWAELVEELLPPDIRRVHILPHPDGQDGHRIIKVE